jgi:hypothetical protein
MNGFKPSFVTAGKFRLLLFVAVLMLAQVPLNVHLSPIQTVKMFLVMSMCMEMIVIGSNLMNILVVANMATALEALDLKIRMDLVHAVIVAEV